MEYTDINGKKISKITLGTVQLGMDYGISNNNGKPDAEQSFQILKTAIEGGITSIDTARSYGSSEETIGNYFTAHSENIPFIITKYKCGLDEDADYNDVEKEVFLSVETSMKKLNLDKIDCLLLHNGFSVKINQGKNIAKAYEKLISRGLISMAGFSVGRYVEEINSMLDFDVFRAVQVPMNVFDHRLLDGGYLEKLEERGINLFVRSVFFQGLFFLNPDKLPDTPLKTLAGDNIRSLHEIAKKENMDVSELAISYIRDMQGVTSLVLGAETKEQVEENLRYLNSKAISKECREEINEKFKNVDVLGVMKELSVPKRKN